MTQEEKELVIKDLCGRLPYGVKVLYNKQAKTVQYIEPPYYEVKLLDNENYTVSLSDIKPCLRPLSSMTEEEHNEWFNYYHEIELKEVKTTGDYLKAAILGESASIDWLNEKMFDFRGLISRGVAISTDVFNPYKEIVL